MWHTLGQVALTVGAVWIISALAARLARKEEQLKYKEQEEKADEIVRETLTDVGGLNRDACLERLRDHKGQ